MATGQKISSTPSFFNFLKEGLLLPNRNRRLFATIFTIITATTCLLLVGNDLVLQPLRDEVVLDTKALNSTDPRTSSPDEIRQLIQKTKDDTRAVAKLRCSLWVHMHPQKIENSILQSKFHHDFNINFYTYKTNAPPSNFLYLRHCTRAMLLTSAAYFLFSVVTRSAIQIVVLFAAVATYSGELQHTTTFGFGSLLGKVKAQLKGPVLTLAFVYALEVVYVVVLGLMAALLMLLVIKKYLGLFFVGSLVLLLSFVFLVYFSILCSMSVVVAVAEPGCHGAGALGRAWRLLKGKRRRAMLLISVTSLLAAAFIPVYTLAKRCAVTSMAAGLLLGLLYSILMAAVQLFSFCAMTALYYECTGSTDEASAAEYVKISTKEQVDA